MNTRSSFIDHALGRQDNVSRLAIKALLVVAGSLLLTLSAKVQVPFYPVPMTMQTLVVIMIGFAFGSRMGLLTVLLYLAEGAAGLPVFAGTPARGLGLAYMAGPTGGYLLGFAVAAYLAGLFAQLKWDRSYLKAALGAGLATLAIYACGLAWLGVIIGFDKPLLAIGFVPFVLGDAVKIILCALLAPSVWRLAKGNK